MYTDPDSIVQIHRIQRLSRDLPVQFQLSFYVLKRVVRAIKQKKFIEIQSLDLEIILLK